MEFVGGRKRDNEMFSQTLLALEEDHGKAKDKVQGFVKVFFTERKRYNLNHRGLIVNELPDGMFHNFRNALFSLIDGLLPDRPFRG